MTTPMIYHHLLYQMLCLPHPKLLKLLVKSILDPLIKINK
jgi:hypothetical protein